MEKVGIYIHIPFCKNKCYYCDFTAYPGLSSWIGPYFKNLEKEIELYQKNMDLKVDSIYIGGGTPSHIDIKYIKRIVGLLEKFDLGDLKEFSLEANPNSLSLKKLKEYRRFGINRISLGVQSFDKKVLKKIGRDHNKEIVLKDIDNIRKAGFDNLSLDMIENLPGGDFESIKNDLEIIKKIDPKHISYYSLILEKGSHFFSLYKKGRLDLMDNDLERDIFIYIKNFLENMGLKRYEISNFSKKGYESYHNKKYWSERGYLGLGLGSAGFLSNKRYTNTKNLVKYGKYLSKGLYPIENKEFINKEEREKEYIIFKLREVEGINLSDFEKNFGYSLLNKYSKTIKKFYNLGFFKIDKYLRFTQKGFDLSNKFYIEII